jgi:hypothetical protein
VEEGEVSEAMPLEEIDRHIRVLNESRDRGALLSSANALAASGDPSALFALAGPLSEAEFLARLDDVENPAMDMDNLMVVFRSLAEHPASNTGRICEILSAQPGFRDNPSRMNLLLVTLARVRPTTPEGAEVFRTSNGEGYAGVNGPLLVQNESPLALQVFEEMIAEDGLNVATKVDLLHRSVLPKRTSLPVVQMCARLLDRHLPPEVKDGIVETLFDHQSKRWFGPVMSPPVPPSWELATTEALDRLIALASRYPSATVTRTQLEQIRQTREPAS